MSKKQEKEIKDGRTYPDFRLGGCYQWSYCSECMLNPLGLGCPKKSADTEVRRKLIERLRRKK